jgi:hypothetical protein
MLCPKQTGETEEPEDMDEHHALDADGSSTQPINIPPPLNVPPSRARRLFAARVAARKKEAEEAAELDAAAAKQVEHSQSNYQARSSSGTGLASGIEDPRSDDSLDGGEDVGIVMRKSVRSMPAPLGKSIFTLDGSGDDEEDDEDDDDDDDDEDEGDEVEADIVEELGRLGIDVRTPPMGEDDVD